MTPRFIKAYFDKTVGSIQLQKITEIQHLKGYQCAELSRTKLSYQNIRFRSK